MIDLNLKKDVKYKRTLPVLFVGTLLCAILCVVVSDFAVPFAVALFALTLLVDRTPKKWVTLVLSVLILLAVSVVQLSYLLYGVEIILGGALLWFFYTRGISKGESVLYLVLVFFVFSLLSVYLDIAIEIGSFSVKEVLLYIEGAFEAAKTELLAELQKLLASQSPPPENGAALLESAEFLYFALYNLLLALFAVLAFFYVGVAVKVFSAMAVRLLSSPRPPKDWYFMPPVVFAYFYVALFIFSFLFSGFDSSFSIAMMNLYYVFLAVFAYLGLKHAHMLVRRSPNPATARLIFVLLLVFGNVLAVQILSLSGVMFVIFNSKTPPAMTGDGRGGPIDPQL